MSASHSNPEPMPARTDGQHPANPGASPPGSLGQRFERILWSSRLLALVVVIFTLLVSVILFIFVSVDVARVIHYAWSVMFLPEKQMGTVRFELVAKVVKIVDLYLVATFMLIFALGVYELFISKIESAENSEVAHRLLLIQDLDDLKNRLVKIVMLILAMLFLEYALRLQPQTTLDLLWLALGTLMISGALFLSQKRAK